MAADVRIPLGAVHLEGRLRQAIADVQSAAKTNKADEERLARECVDAWDKVLRVCEALGLPASELHPAGAWCPTLTSRQEGTHTVVELGSSGWWVRRGTPSLGRWGGRVQLTIPFPRVAS